MDLYINLTSCQVKMTFIQILNLKLFKRHFHPLKLCLDDAVHNFKRMKIVRIWQNGG